MNRPTGNLLSPDTVRSAHVESRRPASLPASPATGRRAFLFLQGPPGPLLHQLAQEMRGRGATVERINICAGDRVDWPEPATNFRGRFRDWPVFIDNFLRKHRITDVLLFGDCRPYHVTARRLAGLRGITTHVLEEGYLRPHWMTLEHDGVNGYSRLKRDKAWMLEEAMKLPHEPQVPPVTASFRRRVRDTARHYIAVNLGGLAYPHYRTHRPGSPLLEALGWGWKYLVQSSRERRSQSVLRKLESDPCFLFPLQLSGDYQIRSHSPFPDMQSATAYVLESFARNAPAKAHLLIKAHPLDCSFFNWSRYIRRRASKLAISSRVHFIDGGNLDTLSADAVGMVCVNSTSATLALRAGTPVCALGDAIYNFEGLTFQGCLDDFWGNPVPPEPSAYAAFRRVLVNKCLVRGGLASESAVAMLVKSMADKLVPGPADQS